MNKTLLWASLLTLAAASTLLPYAQATHPEPELDLPAQCYIWEFSWIYCEGDIDTDPYWQRCTFKFEFNEPDGQAPDHVYCKLGRFHECAFYWNDFPFGLTGNGCHGP